MRMGSNRRLANVKTRHETGLDYIMQNIDLNTPFGKKQLKELKPFFPGEEEELKEELDRVEKMVSFVNEHSRTVEQIQELFMEVKDVSYTITRSENQTLAIVEIYEIKSLLLAMRKLSSLTVKEAEQPDIVKKIGNTTYRVKIHFSTTSKETMSDKIKRLIMNDCGKIS